jgi:DNA-binding MarR family transcriptional regulator
MPDRLERQALVSRGWDPDNRRRSIATITDAGLALLARIDPELNRAQAAFTAGHSRTDLMELRRLCRGLGADP